VCADVRLELASRECSAYASSRRRINAFESPNKSPRGRFNLPFMREANGSGASASTAAPRSSPAPAAASAAPAPSRSRKPAPKSGSRRARRTRSNRPRARSAPPGPGARRALRCDELKAGRVGQPEDVAAGVVFAASLAASLVNKNKPGGGRRLDRAVSEMP
jgi:NAD(P)-dependent dehydrogenase (short-subunit alcohol dehydrogenase family)